MRTFDEYPMYAERLVVGTRLKDDDGGEWVVLQSAQNQFIAIERHDLDVCRWSLHEDGWHVEWWMPQMGNVEVPLFWQDATRDHWAYPRPADGFADDWQTLGVQDA